jgi:putative oxidoreductase
MSKLVDLARRAEAPTFTALRIVSGSLFLFHGVQKIFGWLTTNAPPTAFSQMWVGGIIELVGGILIAVGLATRPAAFLAAGTMAVAYLQFHWKLELAAFRWLPIVNKGELAVLYCFVFLFLAAHGGGPASLDALLARRRADR